MTTKAINMPEYRLDIEEILSRLQSDWALLEELSEILVEEMPGMLDRTREAVLARDAEAIHHAAHYLKGSVGVFGPGRHVDVALRLEQTGRQGNLADVDTMFREVEVCMHDLLGAVRALKEEAHGRSDS